MQADQELKKAFFEETGEDCFDENGRISIPYFEWLEQKVLDLSASEQKKFRSLFSSFLIALKLESAWEIHCENARATELNLSIHKPLFYQSKKLLSDEEIKYKAKLFALNLEKTGDYTLKELEYSQRAFFHGFRCSQYY